MKPEDQVAFGAACKDWETKSAGKDLGEYFWQAACPHRDAQPAFAQEAVANHGRLYAWIYVDQYGLDSISAAKEWCEEMVRLHGGSMFPLYTNPPRRCGAGVGRSVEECSNRNMEATRRKRR